MLLSEKSMTATNATSTRPDTSSAMQSMGSSCFITRTATTTLKAEMSHAHSRSEPSRPAHRPAKR